MLAGSMLSADSMGTSIAAIVAARRPGAPFSKINGSTLMLISPYADPPLRSLCRLHCVPLRHTLPAPLHCVPLRHTLPAPLHCVPLDIRSLLPPKANAGSRPSIHIQNLSSDEVGNVGSEKGDGSRYIGWPPNTSPWYDSIPKLRRVLRDFKVTGHLDDSWSNRVYPNTLGSQFN